jgi:hypothetical protein
VCEGLGFVSFLGFFLGISWRGLDLRRVDLLGVWYHDVYQTVIGWMDVRVGQSVMMEGLYLIWFESDGVFIILSVGVTGCALRMVGKEGGRGFVPC